MRIGSYDVIDVALASQFEGREPRLAYAPDGAIVELTVVVAVRERDRVAAQSRLERVRSLAHPTIPRLIEMFVDPAGVVVVAEHVPRVSLGQIAAVEFGQAVRRLTSDRGLALPLVCTVAHAAAAAIADLHDAGLAHGDVDPWTLAVTLDGRVCVSPPKIVRAHGSFIDDEQALVHTICALICAGDVDDFTPSEGRLSAAQMLASLRPDAPLELVKIVAAAVEIPPRIDMRALARLLARELAWALWTPVQLLDEVRALVPDTPS